MKTDMAAGGAVIAVHGARCATPASRVRVTGLVAAAENMPGGSALRARATSSRTTAAGPSRCSTPTPRAGWCWPTPWPTPTPARPGRGRRRRHPHRAPRRWAWAGGTPRSTPPTSDAGRGLLAAGRGQRRAAVADAAGRGLPRRRWTPRSPTCANISRDPHDLGRVDHGGAVPAGVRRRPAAGRTSTSPARPGPTATSTRSPRAAPGSAPGCCCAGWRTWADPSGSAVLTATSRPSPTGSRRWSAARPRGPPCRARGSRWCPRRAGPGRPPGRATARCRRPRPRPGAAAAAPARGSRRTPACRRRRRPGRRRRR